MRARREEADLGAPASLGDPKLRAVAIAPWLGCNGLHRPIPRDLANTRQGLEQDLTFGFKLSVVRKMLIMATATGSENGAGCFDAAGTPRDPVDDARLNQALLLADRFDFDSLARRHEGNERNPAVDATEAPPAVYKLFNLNLHSITRYGGPLEGAS